jgi:hypothetical protein
MNDQAEAQRRQIDLSGPSGNAFALIAIARRHSVDRGDPAERTAAIERELRAKDYQHLLVNRP